MLRPYQQAAVDQFQDGDLFVSPTGTGKTKTLCAFAFLLAERHERVLWVAHRRELIHQASNALRDAWLQPEANVWVRSIQELRSGGGPEADWLFVDEAHHLPSDDWSKLITEQYPMAKRLGATATPERGDGRGLGSLFQRIVSTITVKQAIEAEYLVPADVLRPERALGPGELALDPVDAYLTHAKGKKAILFAPNVDQAIQYATRFRDHVRSAAVWGELAKKDRDRVLADFSAGRIDVLTSVNVLTEGFDVPDVECVILARGFGTVAGYLQAVGRGLRPSPGKSRALVLDLRGCSHDHGDPDDERTFHLEGRGIRRPGDDADVRFCPVCGAPTVTAECEQCGYSGALRLRPPRVLGLPLDRFARVRADDDEARARRLSKWLGECRVKGWKEGRALHRFNGAYGAFPSRELVNRARALTSG